LTGAWAVVLALGTATSLGGQQQAARSAVATRLDALLDRATIEPGTYVTTEADVQPAKEDLPLVLQADVLRGAVAPAVRVTVSLGTEMPQAAEARFRLVRADGTGIVDTASGSGGPGVVRLVREFVVVPGEYVMQAAVGYARGGDAVTAVVNRSGLSVPNVWQGPLAVTPIMLASAVAAAPDAPNAQPFSFGPTAIGPATRPGFAQQGALNVAFRVYNWQAASGEKPDLSVEYVFYQLTKGKPVFFNRIKPQQLDAESLNTKFDPAGGVVSTGMMIPLRPFPFGRFELRVRVTDHRSKQTAERLVGFAVTPS
jgi:hypothetical protein